MVFIDSGKNTLKAVLFHNGNELPFYAYGMKGIYETMKTLLAAVDYNTHQWNIYGDLKVIYLPLGLQQGYTKHACFLY